MSLAANPSRWPSGRARIEGGGGGGGDPKKQQNKSTREPGCEEVRKKGGGWRSGGGSSLSILLLHPMFRCKYTLEMSPARCAVTNLGARRQ